jgi:tRNA-Thr(GGU) m(6)t(6)A37 methyltransferase TsaA
MSTDQSSAMEGLILAGSVILLFEYFKCYQSKQKFEKAYWGERRGRAQVEREMKKISNIQLNTSEGFFVQPIGHIESCYRQCIGTPRQGMLVPESRASLKLTRNMSPEALDGLENFSHVWISFKFHLNTNTLKESKAFSAGCTFTAKINLPMLKGTQKIGVLATRSPHRPNPVGITLARVDRVDKKNRTVYLKACDLVNGTPVLDIKVHNRPLLLIFLYQR